ncbi:hypothetical protein Ga0080574_TMP4990 (plasmid) [Salipiger abyssi]|uniref:Uncharacterized protein n=1 Tax=Salipiger abyssi TaxID=1250539 RepID=A0A1P8V0U5_9RHOB|nr:hypothetical protein Ga0080574_TMP4990 [Salipiger abyssi]
MVELQHGDLPGATAFFDLMQSWVDPFFRSTAEMRRVSAV